MLVHRKVIRGDHLRAFACAFCLLSVKDSGISSTYTCTCAGNAAAAAGNGSCVCPSTSAPGGLKPSETPQFILFTVCCLIQRDVKSTQRPLSLFSCTTAAALHRPARCPARCKQHDDAITPIAAAALRGILDGRRSVNGGQAVATLFTLARGTGEVALCRQLASSVARQPGTAVVRSQLL